MKPRAFNHASPIYSGPTQVLQLVLWPSPSSYPRPKRPASAGAAGTTPYEGKFVS